MRLRSRVHAYIESSLAPTPHETLMDAPHLGQYGSYYFNSFTNPIIFYKLGIFFAPPPSLALYYTLIWITTPTYSSSLIIPTFYPQSGYATPYIYLSIESQIPPTSLLYRGGSSSQPLVTTTDNIRWEPRMTQHSSTKDRDEDEGEDEYENKEDEESEPQLRRSPSHNRHLSGCGTHSSQ